MTIKSCCCGSGGGAAGPDRVAPTIVVGNVPEGDSATAYSTDGFEYVPDTGNGAGIETALNTLSALGSGGRVYVRRGTYDFTAVGAPVAPLVVDGGVTLSGEGPGTLLIPRDQGNQTLIEVIAGDSALENFKISMPALLPGAVYAGATEGIIEVSAATTGAVRIENITADLTIDTVANGAVVNRLINLVNDSIMTLITRVTVANNGYHLDGEAVWIRFVGIEQISARNVFITDCYAQNFDAGVTIGLTGLCEIKGLICTGFGRRYVHQMASDTQARVTIIGGYGTAGDADAIGLDLHSHQDANATVTNLRLLSSDAAKPAARIRSAANAGHAIFTGCSFTWPHVSGAVLEIGTSGSANPCNRNTINGCHFHNTDATAGSCSVEIFNVGSVSNNVSLNSFEDAAGVGLIDGGSLTQALGNV